MVWLCEAAHFSGEGSAGTEGYSLMKISYRGRLNRISKQDVVHTLTNRRGLRWIHPRSFRTFCRINGGCGFIVSCSQAANRNHVSHVIIQRIWSGCYCYYDYIHMIKRLSHKIRCHIKAAWWVAHYSDPSMHNSHPTSKNKKKIMRLFNTNIHIFICHAVVHPATITSTTHCCPPSSRCQYRWG